MSLFITKEEFNKSKRRLRKYNREWKHFASKTYVGDCSELYRRLKPSSYADFYQKYIMDGQRGLKEGVSRYMRGRTEEELTNNAKGLYELIVKQYPNDVVDFVDCLNVTIGHVIHETYDGQLVENIVEGILSKKGYRVEPSQGKYDSGYGIDRFCYRGEQLLFTVQIKPISFFKGDKNLSLIEDRIKAFDNDDRIRNKFKVKPYYIVYEYKGDSENDICFICNERQQMAFLLEDLCERNGSSKVLPETRYFNK